VRSAICVLLVMFVSGCGSDPDEPSKVKSASSEHGHFRGTFVPHPARPIVGSNRLDATLTTAVAEPLLAASVTVQPWMPAHGHGSAGVPQIAEHEQGHYQIENIVYEMPGQWELRIDVVTSEIGDRFVLSYDVH
jgi:hypothetical protein